MVYLREIILDNIEHNFTGEDLVTAVDINQGAELDNKIEEMAAEALELASPKGIYALAFIDEKKEEKVTIEGIEFCSRVLRVNLEDIHRVFPFIATCGRELHDWAEKYEDLMEDYVAEKIKEVFLDAARGAIHAHLRDTFNPGEVATMNPGSLRDWPINEQKKLFDLLGDVQTKIGVELTSSFLMKPNKTTSGILFSTEVDYSNCRLCPRSDCPNRQAEYDEKLLREKYQ